MSNGRTFYVYIMANDARTIYIGVTNDLERRVWEHRAGKAKGFTRQYGLTKLVYVEDLDDIREAIGREKELKSWRRSKKLALIVEQNPNWHYLAAGWFQ